MKQPVTFANRASLSVMYELGEKSLVDLKEYLIYVEREEPGALSIAELARIEASYVASITQIEESQVIVRKAIEAKTEEEFLEAQRAYAAWHERNPRPAYESFFKRLTKEEFAEARRLHEQRIARNGK